MTIRVNFYPFYNTLSTFVQQMGMPRMLIIHVVSMHINLLSLKIIHHSITTHTPKYSRSKGVQIFTSKGRYLNYVTKMRADMIQQMRSTSKIANLHLIIFHLISVKLVNDNILSTANYLLLLFLYFVLSVRHLMSVKAKSSVVVFHFAEVTIKTYVQIIFISTIA